MNILRRQTQNAVDTPEGVNQLREFGLLVGKQNRAGTLAWDGDLQGRSRGSLHKGGGGEQTTTAANPAKASGCMAWPKNKG